MAFTTRHLAEWKAKGERFTMLTAYDYSWARLVSAAGVPVILVGDSLGQVVLGYKNTLPVTMADMVHHTAAVVRGAPESLVVADMPFLSYQVSTTDAIRNAGRLIQEGGAQAVKLEGGEDMAEVVAALVRADIAVMGHIGLTPQAVHQLGGYRTQAVDEAGQQRLLADARALEQAGVFALVLEKVPAAAAAAVTQALAIPTIGCGAGPACDGQVLVTYDLLGVFSDYKPSFVKRYAELGKTAVEAMSAFCEEVRNGIFPTDGGKTP
ncbi:3-methyl-2-oxobutanoate hydroxymethyltransferase [candidate division FCPU426 bacterium]|nr:3-methyl-2-oxobutanoate hydroxymethyltransferase [candidate division FCPU426 bacterium]